ncbi:hypothetical protein AG1IA_07976 [Rhizoctonia solani AG-1 IA]|uniref:Uncharacterized protein n=1 Tax=Thanatephorus cucumeris (strain AG1-IA) TaxID=983506 RepID=L8WJ85_THACA|nr:hypothetical protein AG1IA_07976 [Rhizoctonia solani AG-1 IA]
MTLHLRGCRWSSFVLKWSIQLRVRMVKGESVQSLCKAQEPIHPPSLPQLHTGVAKIAVDMIAKRRMRAQYVWKGNSPSFAVRELWKRISELEALGPAILSRCLFGTRGYMHYSIFPMIVIGRKTYTGQPRQGHGLPLPTYVLYLFQSDDTMARCLRLQLLSFLTTSCELTVARSFTHHSAAHPARSVTRSRWHPGLAYRLSASPPLTHVHPPVPVVSLSQCIYTPPLLALYWPKANQWTRIQHSAGDKMMKNCVSFSVRVGLKANELNIQAPKGAQHDSDPTSSFSVVLVPVNTLFSSTMLAFGRVVNIFLLVLSLTTLVCASPSSRMSIHKSRAVSARGEEGSLSQLTTLEAVMRKQLDACIKAKTSDEAKAVMNQVVVEVQTTTKSLEQLGKVNVDATATGDIAVRVACIIEFGADFVVGLCVEIDIVLKGLLVTIEGLFAGILVLVLKKIVDVKTSAIMQLDLTQCAKVLARGSLRSSIENNFSSTLQLQGFLKLQDYVRLLTKVTLSHEPQVLMTNIVRKLGIANFVLNSSRDRHFAPCPQYQAASIPKGPGGRVSGSAWRHHMWHLTEAGGDGHVSRPNTIPYCDLGMPSIRAVAVSGSQTDSPRTSSGGHGLPHLYSLQNPHRIHNSDRSIGQVAMGHKPRL